MLFFVAGDGKGVRRQEGMGRIWTRFRSAARCNGTRACLKIHSLNLHCDVSLHHFPPYFRPIFQVPLNTALNILQHHGFPAVFLRQVSETVYHVTVRHGYAKNLIQITK